MKNFVIGLIIVFATQSKAQVFNNVAFDNNINFGYGQGTYGGGMSLCDFNNDGWDDLTIASAEGDSIYFYQNINGVFEKMPSLVDNLTESKQILWLDYDNDGDKDLLVTSYFNKNKLYQNDGDLNLTDVSGNVGIPQLLDPTYGASAGDINKDGLLDLYICNYANDGSFHNYLLLNQIGGGFNDLSNEFGLDTVSELTFCAGFLDINNDGIQDIYTAEDKEGDNNLWKGVGDGLFEDISISSMAGIVTDAMNIGTGDFDMDGDLDLYITNTPGGNTFLENLGDETFQNITNITGTGLFQFSWGGNFFDYDNDGDLDLFVSVANNTGLQSNALYVNNGFGFFNLYNAPLPDDSDKSYANAIGDFNNDGFLDIVVCNEGNVPHLLYQNVITNDDNKWIKIQLKGTESNSDGIGSWIEVAVGDKKHIRYTQLGEAYLAQNSLTQTIGIGENSIIDSIRIEWLSGQVDILKNVIPNQTIVITEGTTTFEGTQTIFGENTICEGDSTAIFVSIDEGIPPYQISISNGNTQMIIDNYQNMDSIFVAPEETSTYQLIEVIDAENKYGFNLGGTAVITVNEQPSLATIMGGATLCQGDSAQISIDILGGTMPYTAMLNNGLIIDNYESGMSIQVLPDSNMTITLIEVEDSNNCNSAENVGSVIFIVNENPLEAILNGDTLIQIGGIGNLSIDILGGIPSYTVIYSDGLQEYEIINYENDENISVAPEISTNYFLVDIVDSNGCGGALLEGGAFVEIDSTVNVLNIEDTKVIISDFYPNPVLNKNTFISINSSDNSAIKMEILNINGKIVKTEKFSSSKTETYSIDLSGCTKGSYLAKFTLDSFVTFRKLIIL
jgi:hypothetical protein